MGIIRERPSQRLHHRIAAPLKARIDGRPVRTLDWSLGGLRLAALDPAPAAGDRLTLELSVPFQGFDVTFAAEAEVVRVKAAGEVAVRFVALGERETELLEFFAGELLTGAMTSVGDAIRRIDAPVTPISTKPDPNPTAETPLRRWSLGKMLRYAGYSALGAATFTYLGFLVYMNIFHIEVDTAVVSAPIEVVRASTGGVIVERLFADGDQVAAGAPLFVIEDGDLENAIHNAEVNVRRAELDRELAATALARARSGLEGRQRTLRRQIAIAQGSLADAQAKARTSAAARDRQASLVKRGLAVREKAEAAEARALVDRNAVRRAEEQLGLFEDALAAAADGRMIDPRLGLSRDVDLRAMAEGDLRAAERRVALAEDELAGLERRRDRLAVLAPTDGRVARSFKSVGAGVRRGEEIALFERSGDRGVEVYLTHDEASAISAQRLATVSLRANDAVFEAEVLGIERAAGGLDPSIARHIWTEAEARSVRVLLAPVSTQGQAALAAITPGAPASVLFDKMSAPRRAARTVARLWRATPAAVVQTAQ